MLNPAESSQPSELITLFMYMLIFSCQNNIDTHRNGLLFVVHLFSLFVCLFKLITLGYIESLELDRLGIIDHGRKPRMNMIGSAFVLVHLEHLLFKAERAGFAGAGFSFLIFVLM